MLAPAKINLMLHVTGRREDGYHLLQSLVMFADTGDDVSLTRAEGFSLATQGEFAPHIEGGNLIEKAATALAAAHGRTPAGRITLRKNLPVGAGLGGGSSDAAAALRLLADDWNVAIPTDLPRALGSDIPACLAAKACWMEGSGERITPLAVGFDVPILLANPRTPLDTAAVYKRLQPPYDAPLTLPDRFSTHAGLLAFLKDTHNTLETPAMTLAPVVGEVISALKTLPGAGLARMSGSGATCFAIFDSQEACERAANALIKSRPAWWVKPATLKGSHG